MPCTSAVRAVGVDATARRSRPETSRPGRGRAPRGRGTGWRCAWPAGPADPAESAGSRPPAAPAPRGDLQDLPCRAPASASPFRPGPKIMVAALPGLPRWFHRTTISLTSGRPEGPTSRSSATFAPPWGGLRPAVRGRRPARPPPGRAPPAAAGNRHVPHVGIDVSRDGRLSRVIPICCLTLGRPEAHRVSQGTRSQPRRDRRSRLPRGHRARRTDGRGLPARGPQARAPPEGGRGLRDRRARGTRSGPTSTRRRSSGSPSRPAPTRSTPATASCPRTRTWPRPARRRASPSSGRRPTS